MMNDGSVGVSSLQVWDTRLCTTNFKDGSGGRGGMHNFLIKISDEGGGLGLGVYPM